MGDGVARVVVDRAVDREFDYAIPEQLVGQVSIGSQVRVPFGRGHATGYVVGLAGTSPHAVLKPIEAVTTEQPLVGATILKLAEWMAQYYCCPRERAIRTVLPSAVRRRGVRFREQVYAVLLDENVSGLTAKQQQIVDALKTTGGQFVSELTASLGLTAAPIKALERKGVVTLERKSRGRDPMNGRRVLPTDPLSLMAEQDTALKAVLELVDRKQAGDAKESRTLLLHGVTGSGKTEVYLQAIAHVLEKGQGAIVLVPEISLTPQTVERFVGRFGDNVAVMHSHLSDGERHDEWHKIRNGEARVVVGARSAVFAPVSDLGLIVVDEEHEPSYKQEDAPRYNARDVAVMRGHLEHCTVVLGSATPSLESWANVRKEKYHVAYLTHRADHRRMPAMRIIDMRLERGEQGETHVLSRDLLDAMRMRLDRAEQIMLFLNRRGYSTSLVCPGCGYVANCSDCSVSLTYHRTDERLRCHLCGGDWSVPQRCPECGDGSIRYAGVGTQRVEKIVKKCFWGANVQRMDADVMTRKDSYDRILGDFRSGKIDILVGTQMIAKGLHFPNVTLVGVIYADLSLHMPDFRAGERTFQLLLQVAGRAGRGEVSGEVIVQTYTPFHAAIQAARRLDYDTFCDQELEFRKELLYPPFSHLTCITFTGPDETKLSFVASTCARRLTEQLSDEVRIGEATPAPIARVRGHYRYQVMLRGVSTRTMNVAIRSVMADLKLPKEMHASIDVDAMSML